MRGGKDYTELEVYGGVQRFLGGRARLKTDFGELLLDQSSDAVIATSPAGKVLHGSKGAEPDAAPTARTNRRALSQTPDVRRR